jgi:hypothetical protein
MDAIVTVDSSALHIAAALGKPHLAVFGGTDERNLAYPSSVVVRKKGHVLEQGPWGHNPGTKIEFNRGAMEFGTEDSDRMFVEIEKMLNSLVKAHRKHNISSCGVVNNDELTTDEQVTAQKNRFVHFASTLEDPFCGPGSRRC